MLDLEPFLGLKLGYDPPQVPLGDLALGGKPGGFGKAPAGIVPEVAILGNPEHHSDRGRIQLV
jgi:hypothetical protein